MGILQNEAHLEWRFRWGNGWGKWRLNDDLNQQDDKTESAASAQDGGRDVDEYLEPIFNEAEWKKTPKNASPSSSSNISGVSVKHVPDQLEVFYKVLMAVFTLEIRFSINAHMAGFQYDLQMHVQQQLRSLSSCSELWIIMPSRIRMRRNTIVGKVLIIV